MTGLDNLVGKWADRYCEVSGDGGCNGVSPCGGFPPHDEPAWVEDPTGQRPGTVLKLKRNQQTGAFTPYAHVLYGARICSVEPAPNDPVPCLGVRPGVVAATAFELDLRFMYQPRTSFNNEGEPTRIQAIEFAVALWLREPRPTVWDFEAQWALVVVSGQAPHWRLWGRDPGGTEGWQETGIVAPRFEAGSWHRLRIRASIDAVNRARRYHGFAVDGVWQPIDTATTYAPKQVDGPGNDLAVHVQLDGPLQSPDDYTVYLDAVVVRWYAQPPWS